MTPELTYLSPEFRPGAVRVLAHRGLASAHETSGSDSSKTIEENTIEAFQNALMAGADYVESDILTACQFFFTMMICCAWQIESNESIN